MAGQVMGKGEAQDRLQRLAQLGQGGRPPPPAAGRVWFSPSPARRRPSPRQQQAHRALGVPRQEITSALRPPRAKHCPRFQRADRGLPPG